MFSTLNADGYPEYISCTCVPWQVAGMVSLAARLAIIPIIPGAGTLGYRRFTGYEFHMHSDFFIVKDFVDKGKYFMK